MQGNSQQRKKSVLITGATSTVGRQLIQTLYEDKRISYVAAVALEDLPYYFQDYDPKRFGYFQTNLIRPRDLQTLFTSEPFVGNGVNTVVHLAFQNRPTDRGEKVHQLNVEGTKALLDKCLETQQVKKFVFKSSSTVYKIKPHNSVTLDEDSELNLETDAPQWIKDRVDADMLCMSKLDNRHIEVVILRIANIVGRNIHTQLNEYLRPKVCFTALGYNPMVNMIHPRDVSRAIQLAIHKKVRGVFNVTGRETAPLKDIIHANGSFALPLPSFGLHYANMIQRVLGVTEYQYAVDQARQKYSLILDGRKAEQLLGYQPQAHVKFG